MADTVMNVAERAPQAAWAAAPASIMVYVDFDAGCDRGSRSRLIGRVSCI